jgi:glycosyltransferase involved in cell wall biosynthesis
MKHIVIDAREYTTGTGRYMFRLLQYLDKLETNHKFTVLLKPHDMDVYQYQNPLFSKVMCPYKEFTFAEQLGFKRQIEQLQPDLVHFGMVQQPVFYKGTVVTTMQDLTTIRFRNPSKNPVVFTAKQQVYKWVNKRVAKKSAHIITISEFVKRDLTAYTGVDPNKITVTYEAADLIPDAAEPVEALAGKQFIMYVGRPLPHKNLGRLIQAFQRLQTTYPELHLALAGKKDALYQQIADRAQAQGIENIIFTDFISEGGLRWMYENCAAYTFPSLSEGFGLPALEAMAHGAPVVSTNATCSPEIYGDGAHYFDPLSVDDMARAIDEVLGNPELREKLTTAGKVQASKYSWQRMAEQTLAVYDSVLQDRH